MISYETYKVLHLWSLLVFILNLGFAFTKKKATKPQMAMIMLSAFCIFLGGMGMMARLGFKHAEPWPTWLMIKAGIWVLLAFPVIYAAKNSKRFRTFILYVALVLMMAAIFVVINSHLFIS